MNRIFNKWSQRLGKSSDIAIALIFGAFILGVLVSLESFELLYEFSRNHESWELDELFTAFMVASIVLAILLFRGARSLRREIKSRLEAERLAQALARQDSLTGVANRRSFEEECERRLSRARSGSDRFALLFIDIDRFKQVNDSLGHETGDRLLQIIASRFKKSIRPHDFLGRVGGDEFAILIQENGEEDTSDSVAERLLDDVIKPVTVFGHEITPSASIGIARYPRDGASRDSLLKKADSAMYRAKDDEFRRIVSYCDNEESSTGFERVLELDFPDAISSGQIIPYYQLISNCRSGDVSFVEVLARWKHPELGILSAGDFITHADATGLIPELFRLILVQACRDARSWARPLVIAVNVAPRQLSEPDFAATVLDILKQQDLPPNRLEIEVTEDALLVDLEVTKKNILRLKAEGVRIALDDFGTGYSSLRQLRELPFDRVKIDRSFISGVGVDPQSDEIVASTINLCRALGMQTVAEGIEDQSQLDWICSHGADSVQGFFNAAPVPAEELPSVLERYPDGRPRH